MRISQNIRISSKVWRHRDGTSEQSIVIHSGPHHVRIPILAARKAVDVIHDYADDYDREQREGTPK